MMIRCREKSHFNLKRCPHISHRWSLFFPESSVMCNLIYVRKVTKNRTDFLNWLTDLLVSLLQTINNWSKVNYKKICWKRYRWIWGVNVSLLLLEIRCVKNIRSKVTCNAQISISYTSQEVMFYIMCSSHIDHKNLSDYALYEAETSLIHWIMSKTYILCPGILIWDKK